MITSTGKGVINSFFAGQTRQLAGGLVFGVGAAAASSTDTTLGFEVLRVPLTNTVADLGNNRIVYKGTIPPGMVSQISEVGIIHQFAPDSGRNVKITEVAGWTNATLTTANARAHPHTVQVNANASTTTTAVLNGVLSFDLSAYGMSDLVALAGTADANTSKVAITLGSDPNNSYTWNFTPATARGGPVGSYATQRISYSAVTRLGNPVVSAITYVAIAVTAGSGGATSFYLDGLRLDKAVTPDELVARTLLNTNQYVDPNIPTEVEYSLGVNIT